MFRVVLFYNFAHFYRTAIILSVSGSQDFTILCGISSGTRSFKIAAKDEHEETHEFVHLSAALRGKAFRLLEIIGKRLFGNGVLPGAKGLVHSLLCKFGFTNIGAEGGV